ncbi:MAG: helix-turn-helix domain-containing protein [Myxococcota bacterium]
MDPNLNIGARVRAQRERRGWTQERLSTISYVSARQIQRIEAGDCMPSGETLIELAQAFDIDVSELRAGFSEDELDAIRKEFFCPHCGSRQVGRVPVFHEYGVDDVEHFECGFTRGGDSRPCPAEPRFPRFEDYQLIVEEDQGRWYCTAIGRTEAARQVNLTWQVGRTRDEAEKLVQSEYIGARDGTEEAQEFRMRQRLRGW